MIFLMQNLLTRKCEQPVKIWKKRIKHVTDFSTISIGNIKAK